MDADIIWLGFYTLLSLCGLYLMGDALVWRLRAKVAAARIVGFQKKRNKTKILPVVSFDETADIKNKEALCRMVGIDSLDYLLRPANVGDWVEVSYLKDNPKRGRVFGYFSLVAGLFLQWPLFYTLVGIFIDDFIQSGFGFLFFTALIITSFWIFMRLVRNYY